MTENISEKSRKTSGNPSEAHGPIPAESSGKSPEAHKLCQGFDPLLALRHVTVVRGGKKILD